MGQDLESKRRYEQALSALEILEKGGFEARLAGGCVRDRQLHAEPKDYDIATTALPDHRRTHSRPVSMAFPQQCSYRKLPKTSLATSPKPAIGGSRFLGLVTPDPLDHYTLPGMADVGGYGLAGQLDERFNPFAVHEFQ